MATERLVGSFLIRFTRSPHATRVEVQVLHTREVLRFETWVAAWAFIDEAMNAPNDPTASASDPA
jgi:hypothetical protein